MSHSLLEQVHGLLARTYQVQPIRRLDQFVIGEAGWERRARGDAEAQTAQPTPQVWIEEQSDFLRLALYLPSQLVSTLERYPPTHGLHDENIKAFATFVEEIDHLMKVVDRHRRGIKVSPVELELQANISKHLVLSRFCVNRNGVVSAKKRAWLHAHLFGRVDFVESEEHLQDRYRDAARYAVRFLSAWKKLPPTMRLRVLRKFYRDSMQQKIRRIKKLAA